MYISSEIDLDIERTSEEILVDLLAICFWHKPDLLARFNPESSLTWRRVPVVLRGIAFYHALIDEIGVGISIWLWAEKRASPL